jgi:hypothetical protein
MTRRPAIEELSFAFDANIDELSFGTTFCLQKTVLAKLQITPWPVC